MLQKCSDFPPARGGAAVIPPARRCDPGGNRLLLGNLGNLLTPGDFSLGVVELNLGVADFNPCLDSNPLLGDLN